MSDATLVIGGGTMGAGIAEVFLDAGASVTLVESNAAVADRLRAKLGNRAGFTVVDRVSEHIPVDLVVEAVPEDLPTKRHVLAGIERHVPESSVLASNTSSLSINAIAEALTHPSRFIGMHFFNPVPKSALVELVTGDATTTVTTEQTAAWVRRLGKELIVVRDSPGFATSRLGVCIGLEAIRMVEEGVASAEDIDRGMVLGYRFPMGPLKLTDLVGLDVRLSISDHLARELGPRFEPPQLLRRMVANGLLGKKSGKGFYEWS